MLRGGERWQRRHEVLSLVFLDWIAPAFSSEEQKWILAAIASHHRDQNEISRIYDPHTNPELVEEMVSSLGEETVRGLWGWLNACATSWIGHLNLSVFGVQAVALVDEETAVRMVCKGGEKRTNDWLKRYRRFIQDLNRERNLRVVTTLVMLRGLTTTADHSGSAHLPQIPQGLQCSWQGFARQVFQKQQEPIQLYKHQQESAGQHGTSAMLIAPTGSGKTEAALFWALGEGNVATPRLFYTLPYQASMNAMYDRLRSKKCFGEGQVGLQHGRALQALYQRLSEEESGPASAMQETQWRINLNRLHAYPIKVFSPYQMLKTLYQIKGFEAALTDYTQAAFIFDEIHAYDANRLALILALIKHLRLQYGARFFIMSATFPSILRDIMEDVLGIQDPIVAEKSLFKKFQRHFLRLLDGELLTEGVEQIVRDVQQGKSVLVCCNTVQRAQDMHSILSRLLPPEQVELIHSRLIMRDRLKREKAIKEKCEVGVDLAGRGLAVVATQVVEVSLNIDLDTIYSDPAPLDALVQRFGRVNRALKKGIVPVHVMRSPRDGQYVYSGALVQKTLEVLEGQNNENIDEAAIGEWLDEIYGDPEIATPWRQAFDAQYKLATGLLRALRPFNSDEQREEEFEALFDGVDVLPRCFEREYLGHIAKDEFIEASQFFVSISQRKYQQLARQGKIRPMDDTTHKKWIVLQDYDPEQGLIFDTATPELNKEL
jgi:CRISPR-associated endonuclease/helicase Cas3